MELKVTLVLTADPALLSTLQALTGWRTTPTESPAPAITPASEKAPKKTTTAKAATLENASPNGTTSSDATEAKPSASTSTDTYTLESLRALAVPKSKAGHKDVIKKWLSDAGYASLQDLQEKDFNSFHAFIEKL